MFLSTHKPTTVSGLDEKQILVFKGDEGSKIEVEYPLLAPKGLTSDGILTQIFEMDYTYDDVTYNELLDRRKLYAKQMFDKEHFTKEDALKLADLTTKLSDYSENYADGLFYEFVHELDKSGGLDSYRKIDITPEDKAKRREEAEKILEKLRQKRNAGK